MFRKIIFLIVCLITGFVMGQQDGYIYVVKDNKYGIKTMDNKMIIPIEMINIRGYENGQKVEGKIIYLDSCPKNVVREDNGWGCVYDLKGNLLYQVYNYDVGADDFLEGYHRLIKNGKMGFANREGQTSIPAEYDFVSSFNYGYAEYCKGCHWERLDEEHKTIVGGEWGVINKKGEVIKPISKPHDKEYVLIRDKYYPYPFSYTSKEKEILDFFELYREDITDLMYYNYYSKLEENQKKVYFEIVDKPSANFPYYTVYTYDYTKQYNNDYQFLVSEDGKEIYHFSDFKGVKMNFNTWFDNKIKEAKDYQQKYPNRPNKIVDLE